MRERIVAIEKLVLIMVISITISSDHLKHVCGQIQCDPACQRGIDNTYSYTTRIHQELTEDHDKLLQRVSKLESEEVGVIAEINTLTRRINTVEGTLRSNISQLQRLINEEIGTIWRETTNTINSLESYLNNRINNLTRIVDGYHNFGGTPTPHPLTGGDIVFLNLTRRIDSLEFGKVYNLTVDNQMWRRNFRVINSTFARIKNNNCIC